MKEYKIPVIWQMYGIMEIEANSLEEAKEIAMGNLELPRNGSYIDDSFEIDNDVIEEMNKC